MLINLRGTSGSGKSTIVRKLMSWYRVKTPVFAQPRLWGLCVPKQIPEESGRKAPIAYLCSSPNTSPLVVLGHYSSPCGGCDTINSYERIFELVQIFHTRGNHVLFEGLLLSGVVNQVVELWEEQKKDLLVIALQVPLEECLRGVANRRQQRDDTDPLNPKNTEAKFKGVQQAMARLSTAGVPNVWLTRSQALERLRKEFNI